MTEENVRQAAQQRAQVAEEDQQKAEEQLAAAIEEMRALQSRLNASSAENASANHHPDGEQFWDTHSPLHDNISCPMPECNHSCPSGIRTDVKQNPQFTTLRVTAEVLVRESCVRD